MTLTTFAASMVASCVAAVVVSLLVMRFRCRFGAHLPGVERLWVRREDGYPEAIAHRCVRCGRICVTLDDVMAERGAR